jgi:hypothetical protein
MEREMGDFLRTVPSVFTPDPKFFEKLVEGAPPDSVDPAAKLRTGPLKVGEDSCYGRLSIHCMNMANPSQEDWDLSEKLGVELIDKGLCHSLVLRQGCESRGFFGKRTSPAIIASPDFAKLTVLKWFDQLDVSGLPAVVEKLDSKVARERYCENTWKALMVECKADPRFAPALAKAGR